jgi:hypothetical protein
MRGAPGVHRRCARLPSRACVCRHEKRIQYINITVSALRMELAAMTEKSELLQVQPASPLGAWGGACLPSLLPAGLG